MADTTLSIGVVAELKDFEAQMAKLPGIGAKEARDMVQGIRRELKAATAAADDTAKGMTGSFSKEFNKTSSALAALSSQFGGEFGRIGSLANSAIKPLGEVAAGLGEVGLAASAVGASAVLIGGVGFAVDELAASAQSAAAELSKMGVGIDAGAAEQIKSYTDAQNALTTAVDKAKVAIGSDFAEALGIVDQAFATDLTFLTKFVEKMGSALVDVSGLRGELDKLAQAVGSDAGAAKASKLAESTVTVAQAQQAYNAMLADQIAQQPEVDAAFTSGVKAQATLNAAIHDGTIAVEEKTNALHIMTDAQFAAFADQTFYDAAQADAAKKQAESLKNASEHWASWGDAVESAASDAAAAVKSMGDNVTANLEKAAARTKALHEAEQAAVLDDLGGIQSVTQAWLDSVQQRVDAGAQLTFSQQREVAAVQAINEAAALTAAGVQATLAAISGIASLQEIGVPAPIAVGLGIAEGVGLFTAAAAGIVAGQPMRYSWSGGTAPPGEAGPVQPYDANNPQGPGNNSKPTIPTGDGDGGVGPGMGKGGSAPSGKGGSMDRRSHTVHVGDGVYVETRITRNVRFGKRTVLR